MNCFNFWRRCCNFIISRVGHLCITKLDEASVVHRMHAFNPQSCVLKKVLTNTLTNNHYIKFDATVFVPVKTIIKEGVRLHVLMHLVQTSNIGVCYFERSKNWGGSLGFYSQCHLCFEIWHIVIDVELRTSNPWTCKDENRKYLHTRLLLIMLKITPHAFISTHRFYWAYKWPFLSSL